MVEKSLLYKAFIESIATTPLVTDATNDPDERSEIIAEMDDDELMGAFADYREIIENARALLKETA